jgi:hypothetical protein
MNFIEHKILDFGKLMERSNSQLSGMQNSKAFQWKYKSSQLIKLRYQ